MRRALVTLGFAALCASPSIANAQEEVSDPWEGFNRDLFAVHEAADRNLLEPIARGYRAITPQPIRTGVVNFLRNLRGPVVFANNILQGDLGRAGVTAARFGVNTTIGVAGLFDAASSMGLERRDEDFGQTLAVWGVDAGPYIFIPLLGPTTVRDGAGRIVDIAFDPLTWAEFDEEDAVRTSRIVLTGLSAREASLESIDNIRQDSFDPYVTIRTSYGLLRASAVRHGPSDVQDLPEFEDIPSEPAPDGTAPDAQPPSVGALEEAGEKS